MTIYKEIEKFGINEFRFTIFYDSGMGIGEDLDLSITLNGKPVETIGLFFADAKLDVARKLAKRIAHDSNSLVQDKFIWASRIYSYTAAAYHEMGYYIDKRSEVLGAVREEKYEELYQLIKSNIAQVMKTKKFTLFLQNYRKYERKSKNEIDSEMQDIVNAFNKLGFTTIFSCQGTDYTVWLNKRPIYLPFHMAFAHVTFKSIPKELLQMLSNVKTGAINQFRGGIFSKKPELNKKFREELRQVIRVRE